MPSANTSLFQNKRFTVLAYYLHGKGSVFVASCKVTVPKCMDVMEGEALALLHAIQRMLELHPEHVIFEVDSKGIVDKLPTLFDVYDLWSILHEYRTLMDS